MSTMTRREFLSTAAILGASAAWARLSPRTSRVAWTERRDLFPEGVASGDPRPGSVVLWTRCPGGGRAIRLTVEVAEDASFGRVIASTRTVASPENDWTVRVLVEGLAPSHEYLYRFTDANGAGS